MMDSIVSIGSGLIVNFLYDAFKTLLGSLHDSIDNMPDLTEIVEEAFGNEFQDILESDSFTRFLHSSSVRDCLYCFAQYTLFGDLALCNRLDNGNVLNIFTEKSLGEYLERSYYETIRDFQDKTVGQRPDDVKVHIVIQKLIGCIKSYFAKLLDREQKIQVSLINAHFDLNTVKIIDYVNSLRKKIEELMESQAYISVSDYAEAAQIYMQKMEEMYEEEHIYLMDDYKFSDFYVNPSLCLAYSDTIGNDKHFDRTNEVLHRIDWKNIFDASNIIYILGGAGYGKSLFMKYLIGKREELSIIDIEKYIVIYGQLKDFYKFEQTAPNSVANYLKNCMIQSTGLDESEISKELVNEYIKAGRCIILLDALDEVPREKREDLHRLLVTFFKGVNHNNKICITSRGRGFIPQKRIRAYNIMRLNKTQVEAYIDKMITLSRFSKENRTDFLKKAERLISSRFLSSFLILSLLVSIYRSEKDLPSTKLELYQKCFEYIAKKREIHKSKVGDEYTWRLLSTLFVDNTFMELAELSAPNNASVEDTVIKNKLLEVYEDEYSCRNDARNAIDTFLTFCSERTEVYVPAEAEDYYRFFHRSFYEYFYAEYLVFRQKSVAELYETLILIDLDSEVFELVVAMLKNNDISKCNKLIQLLCDKMIEDLASPRPRLIELNILGIVMPQISNHKHIQRFISELCNNSRIIQQNHQSIVANRQMRSVIQREDIFINDVKKCFKEYEYEEVVEIIEDVFGTKNEYPWTKDEAKWRDFAKSFFLIRMQYESSFYTLLNGQIDEKHITNLLKEIRDNWLKVKYSGSKAKEKKMKRIAGHISVLLAEMMDDINNGDENKQD